MNEIIRSIEAKQIRQDLPKIDVGDTVRVWVKVVEGSRERQGKAAKIKEVKRV